MERSQYKNYLISIMPYTFTGSINVECNNVTMINQGTQNVTINGTLLLRPFDSITFPGYPGEMNTQAYDIVFTNDRETGARLVLILKEYKKE